MPNQTYPSHWKRNNPEYFRVHSWLVANYGKASSCDDCGNTEAKRYEWANVSGEYRQDRADFKPLCASCHRYFDKGSFCYKGHELTPDNIYVRPKGWRACKKCTSDRSRRAYERKLAKLKGH